MTGTEIQEPSSLLGNETIQHHHSLQYYSELENGAQTWLAEFGILLESTQLPHPAATPTSE